MANLIRKSYTKRIPVGAEFITARGVPSARFRDRTGRVITAPLTSDGKRIRVLSPYHYGRVNGKVIRLFKDGIASQQRLAEMIRKAERNKTDLADPFEVHRARPLVEHLAEYQRFLAAEGSTAKYVAQTAAAIEKILRGCGFTLIHDLTSEKVNEFLYGLRRDPPRPALPTGKLEFTPRELADALGGQRPAKLARVIAREQLTPGTGEGPRRRYPRATVERLQDVYCRGLSIRTSNSYLTGIKGFSRWLVEKERTDRNRLVTLSKLNANTDRRHERRALDETELNGLLSATWQSNTTFQGMAGRDRSMLYMLAMTTGLRASELASVTPASFVLESDRPIVKVRAAYTKNRLDAEQPLPADVAEAFRGYVRGRPPLAPLWPGKWNELAAEMLRGDLSSAGIPYRDAQSGIADFHSLRHSYVSLLGRLGNTPTVTQTLARHSDIRLTMNTYSHAQMHDLTRAVEGFQIVPPDSPRPDRRAVAAESHGDANDTNKDVKRLPFPCSSNEERGGNMRGHDVGGPTRVADHVVSEVAMLKGDADNSIAVTRHDEKAGVLGFEPELLALEACWDSVEKSLWVFELW